MKGPSDVAVTLSFINPHRGRPGIPDSARLNATPRRPLPDGHVTACGTQPAAPTKFKPFHGMFIHPHL